MIRWAIVLLVCISAASARGQEALDSSGYSEIEVRHYDELEMDFQGRFEHLTAADFTLVAENEGENVPIKADRVEFTYPDEETNKFSRIVMTGHVEIRHPQGRVTAARAEFDFNAGVIEFTGDPVMYNERAPEGVFGETVIFDLNQEKMTVRGNGRVPRVLLSVQGDAADRFKLAESDVSDWPAFIAELKRQNSAGGTAGSHIVSLLDRSAQSAVTTLSVDDIVGMKPQIVKLLNGLLEKPGFYDAGAWGGAQLDPRAADALGKGPKEISSQQLVWSNRAALRAAFPSLVAAPPDLGE